MDPELQWGRAEFSAEGFVGEAPGQNEDEASMGPR
jgi:hypothetical protein